MRGAIGFDKHVRKAMGSGDGEEEGLGRVFGEIGGMVFFGEEIGTDGLDCGFDEGLVLAVKMGGG